MSERRYVVEIARAVSDDRIESVADYVAVRLGMDRQRIHTLLAGRTGPVTKPVLAEKADSIAEVFTTAGVSVMIMEASEQAGSETRTYAGDAMKGVGDSGRTATAGYQADYQADYEAEYEEEFAQAGFANGALEDETLADDAFEGAAGEDDVYEDAAGADDTNEDQLDGPAVAGADAATGDVVRVPTADPEPVADTWNVDSAWQSEDDDVPWGSQPTRVPGHALGSGPAREENLALHDDGDGRASDSAEAKLPSTRWVPSPFDDPHDVVKGGGSQGARPADDLKVSWGDAPPERTGARTTDHHEEGDDLTGFEPVASRPWVTPGRSQFGDMSPPSDRAPLRSYLMWALVVSVVLLIVLQLVFAVRERGAGTVTYESGLVAYRTGDFVTARRTWEEVAKSGSPEAQYMLGHLLENGLGQPWSNARAAVWYRQAADQGLPEAQAALADLYIRGVGVEPSLETGAQWLQRAAASGYPPALYRYAELLLHGRGVAQDFDASLDLFARAAVSGSSEAADYVALAQHVRASALAASGQQ